MKAYSKSILFILSLFAFLMGVASAAAPPLNGTLAPILQKVTPAVVNITAQGVYPALPAPYRDAIKRNKNVPKAKVRQLLKPRKFTSLGSGVIINPKKGYILTNSHVVNDVKTITVTLSDGRRFKAKIIGKDPSSDVAVIKIKAHHLKTLPIADSSKLQVGDFVVAIGNPFGLNFVGSSQTATFGIISALQRSDLRIEGVENFIQTDAAINPGNSGGALIDTKGRLIGINTAIISPLGGGNVGVGFAIPINMAKRIMNQLIKYGSIKRGIMGIYVQRLTPELAQAFGIDNTHGALITQVLPNSSAQKAGIQPGDIILAIDGHAVKTATEVRNTVRLLRVGTTLNIKLLRKNKIHLVSVSIGDIKKQQTSSQAENPFLYGLALKEFDQQTPTQGRVTGVQIVGASENSAGWRAGLRPGDVITGANQHLVKSIQGLFTLAEQSKHQLLIRVLRNQGALYLVIN